MKWVAFLLVAVVIALPGNLLGRNLNAGLPLNPSIIGMLKAMVSCPDYPEYRGSKSEKSW